MEDWEDRFWGMITKMFLGGILGVIIFTVLVFNREYQYFKKRDNIPLDVLIKQSKDRERANAEYIKRQNAEIAELMRQAREEKEIEDVKEEQRIIKEAKRQARIDRELFKIRYSSCLPVEVTPTETKPQEVNVNVYVDTPAAPVQNTTTPLIIPYYNDYCSSFLHNHYLRINDCDY